MEYENIYLKMVGKSDIKCLIMEIEEESRHCPENKRNMEEVKSDIDLIFAVMARLRIRKIPGNVFLNILYSCRVAPEDMPYYKYTANEIENYVSSRLVAYKEDEGDFEYGEPDQDFEHSESCENTTKTIYDIMYGQCKQNKIKK